MLTTAIRGSSMPRRLAATVLGVSLAVTLAVPVSADQVGIGAWGGFDLPCGKTYTSVPIGVSVSRWGISNVADLVEGEVITVTLEPIVQPSTGDPVGVLEIVGPATTEFTVPIGWRGELTDPGDATKSVDIAPFFRLRYTPDPGGFTGGIGVIAHLRGSGGYASDVELASIGIDAEACPIEPPEPTTVTPCPTCPAPATCPSALPCPTQLPCPGESSSSSASSAAPSASATPSDPSTSAAAGTDPLPIGLAGILIGVVATTVVLRLLGGSFRKAG